MKLTTLADLFPLNLLAQCLAERMVVARKHPSMPLTILNYTERCQYERGLWNPVTLQSRGLIHNENGEVLARPFRKFFNYGDATGGDFSLSAPVCVTDKLDGSLGILYAGDRIATRGSFDSEQAQHATALYRSRYAHITAPDGWTMLFEIIYPQNRIVLDYGAMDDLVLLGMVEIATGRSVGPSGVSPEEWTGPRAAVFPFATLADALAASPRQNAEGLVVYFDDTGERLKVKQEDYVALHKIVTGLNERTVWSHLVEGKPLSEILDAIPDEFQEWVREVAGRLTATVEASAREVESAYSAILAALPESHTRKDFALVAKDSPRRAQLFARLDGKDYARQLWDEVYPSPRNGPRGIAPTAESA